MSLNEIKTKIDKVIIRYFLTFVVRLVVTFK